MALNRYANFTVDVEKPYKNGEMGVYKYLEVFEKCRIKATFFVTGDVAMDTPEIVKAILKQGHEIGSHGLTHPYIGQSPDRRSPFLNSLSRQDVDRHLKKSKHILEQLGASVRGFRAPWFRINGIIHQNISKYYEYDSSSIGLNGAKVSQSGFYQIPVTAFPLTRIPIGTPMLFGYFPQAMFQFLIPYLNRTPLTIYGHSFDLVRCSSSLHTLGLKKLWYFNRCGPDKANQLIELISELKKNHTFITIGRFIDVYFKK